MVSFSKASLLPTVAESMPKQYTALRQDRGRRSSSSSSSSCFDWITSRKTRRSIVRILKLGPLIQLCVLLTILALALQSDSQASFAGAQLRKFKEEESTLLLQLQRIERQSIQLHENIRTQLKRAGMEDFVDPLGEQTSQLYEMTQELNEQVETLQNRITESSINHIIHEYGEGPVKVVVELEFVDDADKEIYPSPDMEISIVLWPDTPHAIWVWLGQIGRHVWDDSVFDWDAKQTIMELSPSKADPLKRGRLEFVEHHNNPHLHGAWTIGLRQTKDTGNLQMFINLQDNAYHLKHETCVGKILDGFDALQRLLEAKRAAGELSVVRVKRVNAMHMTQREIGYY